VAQIISGTYTIVNPKTGGYRTVKIQDDDFAWWTVGQRPAAGTRSVRAMVGPDNERSYTYVGTLTPDGRFSPTRRQRDARLRRRGQLARPQRRRP
jgi:hypothetical protein